MINVLQYIHDRHIIHRDMKPDNFIMGYDSKNAKLYLLDFGLAKKYRSSKTLIQYPYIKKKKLTGTARYASIHALEEMEQSRRDDLESAGYVLIYFLRGSLPWQGLKIKTKEERYKKILEKKREISSDDLCRDYPEEFKYYIDYTKELGYNENPNYDKLKKNFLFLVREKMCENFDFIYDWTSSNDLKKRERNLDILLIGDSDNNSGNINNNCFKEEHIIKYNTNKNENNENNKEQIKLENIDNEDDEENPNNMAKTENNLAKNEKDNKENVESTCCQM
jgi:serine/threonine protein kinase